MRRPARPALRSRVAGFSLIEMLGVMLVTSLVLLAIVNTFQDLSSASVEATALTRDSRRSAAVLERIARDLESAVLMTTPEGQDPLSNPWVFLAEGGAGGRGAERVKFVSRGRIPRASATHESDLQMVAYLLLPSEEDDTQDLVRWSSPRIGDALDRAFPRRDDPGVMVLAHDVADFGVRLLDDTGAWSEEWDSSALVRSGQLPRGAEINLAIYPEELDPLGFEEEEPPLWTRRVAMPVRPVDLAALVEAEAAGEEESDGDEEDEDPDNCVTVGACMLATGFEPPGVDELLAARGATRDTCLSEVADVLVGADLSQCADP